MSIPRSYTFVAGTTIDSAQVNQNFADIGDNALDRRGDTITGNIAVNNGITIDGIDLSVDVAKKGSVQTITGAWTFSAALVASSTLAVSSTAANALDVAGGINAGSGNVGIVDTTGKIPAISSTYFASLDGSALTSLNGSNISSGTVAVARLGSGSPSSANFLRGDGSWAAAGIKSVQQFTTTITAGNTSQAQTITSIDTTKSFIALRSIYASANADNYIVTITNATTVTVSRATSTGNVGVAYTVVEFN